MTVSSVPWVLGAAGLEALIETLRRRGYRVAGPVARGGAVALEEIESAADLPRGVSDVQEPGRYRLEPTADGNVFPILHGAHSWKRFLLPARHTLLTASREGSDLKLEDAPPRPAAWAFVGVRACDLAAIHRQDRILLDGKYPDAVYRRNRADAFIVAVGCDHAGETCFCASMGTGPAPRDGYDIVLSELGRGRLLAQAGTERGASLLDELPKKEAASKDVTRAAEQYAEAARSMGETRRFDPAPLVAALPAAASSPGWDDVGKRCLACGNCTSVCPTCFCTNVEEATDLTARHAERKRSWDSCFTLDFSYLHGGSVRRSPGARYRQWLTHKFSSWVAQFGAPGCVGCGRCVTWCPVGIDLTAEASSITAGRRNGRTA